MLISKALVDNALERLLKKSKKRTGWMAIYFRSAGIYLTVMHDGKARGQYEAISFIECRNSMPKLAFLMNIQDFKAKLDSEHPRYRQMMEFVIDAGKLFINDSDSFATQYDKPLAMDFEYFHMVYIKLDMLRAHSNHVDLRLGGNSCWEYAIFDNNLKSGNHMLVTDGSSGLMFFFLPNAHWLHASHPVLVPPFIGEVIDGGWVDIYKVKIKNPDDTEFTAYVAHEADGMFYVYTTPEIHHNPSKYGDPELPWYDLRNHLPSDRIEFHCEQKYLAELLNEITGPLYDGQERVYLYIKENGTFVSTLVSEEGVGILAGLFDRRRLMKFLEGILMDTRQTEYRTLVSNHPQMHSRLLAIQSKLFVGLCMGMSLEGR